ncbi:glycosyl transferase family 2 family protein [Asticcacaulis biprosthecium C19]|uniref:Glycosyl transferase family 2 family protein n=1 Tax=Asticcacaulis biprosthecium C19 TaxID=715226 RepID=F4QL18_9CAUL|nr:glycosyltransferase family 2 protein [Asticcacaulis biprosthecium]EGF92241.1 glycosyl transferase family 2 family protein [Asticcacaulis biprosthecium C19]
MTDVTLITLSYNSGIHTQKCLEALGRLGGNPVIVHADNGSTDSDLDALAGEFPQVRQIRNTQNLGFAKGMNQAAATATTEWIGFINPDAFVDRDWLRAMQSAIDAHPQVSIFTALQVDAERPEVMDGAGDSVTFFGFPYRSGFGHPIAPMELAEVFAPCGAAMLIRRELFERLGGFDERFFCYCEDADLGFRARLAGEITVFVSDAKVAHIGSASTSVRSDFALYHGYRNRLWLYVKSMPLVLLVVTLPVHLGLTLVGAIKDTLKGKAGIVWTAIFDALGGMVPILRSRNKIQRERRITALRLAKSLTWNPLKIATRAVDHRRLP